MTRAASSATGTMSRDIGHDNLQRTEEHNLLRGLVRRSCTIKLSEPAKAMAPIVVEGRCRATMNAGDDWTRTILCLVTCLTERQLHHGDHIAYKQQQQHSFGSGKVAAYAVGSWSNVVLPARNLGCSQGRSQIAN